MMRQDYLLRLLDELRQFVGQILASGDPARAGEVLHAILHAQQRLFQVPPPEFLGLSLDAQIDLLAKAEAPAAAVEKVITYATTLVEAAKVYAATNRDDMADGSRQLALGALLIAAQRWPEQRSQLTEAINARRAELAEDTLNPPVRELLQAWDEALTESA